MSLRKQACRSLAFTLLFGTLFPCNAQNKDHMPTICILGGTPSTKHIIQLVPDSLRARYRIISFDRPGFGTNENTSLDTQSLEELAQEAGVRRGDFGIIGISGGAPLALYLASKYQMDHCGIINGMVAKESYFQYADSTITKGLMIGVLEGYTSFAAAANKFPNLNKIVQISGAESKEKALWACYREFRFLFSDDLHAGIENTTLAVDWWHGDRDTHVPLESAQHFLQDYGNARLTIIPDAGHDVDLNTYIAKIISNWE
jgi:pimeloyl-ACP methyl ester carboxylesterase